MARRRRRDENEPGDRRRRPSADDFPDRRAMERALHGIVGQADPGTPQGQAQEILFQAFLQSGELPSGDPAHVVAIGIVAQHDRLRLGAVEKARRDACEGRMEEGPLAFDEVPTVIVPRRCKLFDGT